MFPWFFFCFPLFYRISSSYDDETAPSLCSPSTDRSLRLRGEEKPGLHERRLHLI